MDAHESKVCSATINLYINSFTYQRKNFRQKANKDNIDQLRHPVCGFVMGPDASHSKHELDS